jgi:predicted amidohydrolase/ribosomal protein S18 acetylase RimI-like enzyme
MTKIDPKEFEKKVKVRRLTPDDYKAVTEIQQACFPGMKPWTPEQWKSIMETFPEGQIGVEYKRKLVASSCSLILNFDEYSGSHSWNELTGNGTISTHRPDGDTLYGIEIMVDPKYRSLKLARRIYEARKTLVRERNLKRIVIGGRVPNYHKHQNKLTIRQYVDHVTDKKKFDPVLTTQLSNGFMLKRIIRDYLPNDVESGGYATYLEWVNLDYHPVNAQIKAMSPYVRACAVQYQMRMINDFEEFERNCEYFVDVASDYRCDIVLFPEMFTMQLLTFLPNKRPGKAIRMLSEFTGKYIDLFTRLAVKYNTNIIGGTHFIEEEGDLYNVSYLFRRDGSVDRQYKIHITPHERKWWGVKPGNKVEVFDTDCGKIAILICYDMEFPELARIAVKKGAKIIFCPFNTDERRGYLRVRYCAQARAVENQIYVVASGCVGNLPQVENMDIQYAQSGIFTPSDVEFQRDGVAAICEAGEETIVFQDLDMHLLNRNKDYGSVQTWNDRRLDLYKVVYREGDGIVEI